TERSGIERKSTLANPKCPSTKAKQPMQKKTKQSAEIVRLHDRLTITLSPEVTRLVRSEIENQVRQEEEWERRTLERRAESARWFHDRGYKAPAYEQHQRKPPQTPEQIVEYAIRTIYEPIEEFGQRTGCARPTA